MHIYRNQTLEGQPIVLDECFFENCAVKDCDLFFSGGDVEWVNSHFQNCRIHWRGAAKNALTVMKLFGLMKEVTPQLDMPKSSSGTVH
jgi:hypothetical protein